jgi:hypothetical protein
MRLRAVVLTALAGAALAVPAAPAAAASCTEGGGVTVVVDFASLGGGTPTRCAPGDPSSGLAALRSAGFTPTRAAQEPGYFVCRIDGKPANDPCQRTSPANAYWSYWNAKPGGTWMYASSGAADHDPAPGTVEGWAFGAGLPPSTPPPANRPASASPAPSASTVRASSGPTPQKQSPPASSSAVPTARASASTAPSDAVPPVAVPTPSESAAVPPPPTPNAEAGNRVLSAQQASRRDGIPLGVIAAATLVLVLGGGAVMQVVRRRRAGGG